MQRGQFEPFVENGPKSRLQVSAHAFCMRTAVLLGNDEISHVLPYHRVPVEPEDRFCGRIEGNDISIPINDNDRVQRTGNGGLKRNVSILHILIPAQLS
jgi:hypothetical protein